jgi:hypothetical protein
MKLQKTENQMFLKNTKIKDEIKWIKIQK